MHTDKSEQEVLEELVNYSRMLGSNNELVLHGGGNTSVKTVTLDHTGRSIKALYVKGSGSNLATIDREGFTRLRLEDLLAAGKMDQMSDETMVDYLQKSMFDPGDPFPSVESFLHAFIPREFVLHSHADSILSITNTDLTPENIRQILGNVLVLPYIASGFKLAKAVMSLVDQIRPETDGIVLMKHGLFTFSDTAEEAWNKHLKIISAADNFIKQRVKQRFERSFEQLPWEQVRKAMPVIRGALSRQEKKVLSIDSSGVAMDIALSKEGEQLSTMGPATPDMLVRTKHDFLYLASLEGAKEKIDQFAVRYKEESSKYAAGRPIHDPYPSVIIIRGFGIIAAGKNDREANIIHDLAIHSFIVNANASRIGKQEFVTMEDSYHMEYWPLQEAKLMKSARKRYQGSISIVTGAANGIGLESFRKLSESGSVVIACDVDRRMPEVAAEVSRETGTASLPVILDLSREESIRSMFDTVIRTFGGVDIVFNNAGILKSDRIEDIKLEDLDLHYAVISRASFIMTQEAMRIMKAQGIGGNIVYNITKNVTHPGVGMTSYGSSKAFAAQVCHYAAKEGGPYGIRANIINPDKIFKGSKIWENGVLEARAKAKGQTVEEYKTQNLLRREVLPEHVANVLLAIIDEETFGATTDAMIPVDGGVI
jgi:rhamnose utilization protein RhaD (predicted bifunctional aldolase and dehydrogenase)/NAD(P)-dependent dehydrogenase (short-subunit alcohol dehydrogenase family)